MYMKKVNSIRVFSVLAVLFCVSCYQVFLWERGEEAQELPQTEEMELLTAEEKEPEPESEKEPETEYSVLPAIKTLDYKFVIVEEGDYLTVYHADRETIYEFTDIRYSDLDDSLRQKIRKGYCIRDEAELFGFLENYSS